MAIIDDIDDLDPNEMDEEDMKNRLHMFTRRAVVPLSLMELQNFDFLPRDWDVLEHVHQKSKEVNEHYDKEMLDTSALIKIGNILYLKQEFEGATALYQRALEQGEIKAARKNIGITRIAQGDLEGAMETLDEALEMYEDDPELWFYLGLAWEQSAQLWQHGDREKKEEHLEKALECYTKSLELDPANAPARYNKGMVLTLLGRKEEARELITDFLHDNPASESGWVARGLILRGTGDIEGALKCYENAVTINPDSHIAWLNKSVALFSLERYEEALEAAQKCIELNEDSEIAWCNKGAVLCEMGRHEDSMECFDRALELNPGFEGARVNKEKALEAIAEKGDGEGEEEQDG